MDTQEGKEPTEEDDFYLKWGQETIKNNITLTNDILKQLITLSSALLGVSIIYNDILKNNFLRIVVLLSFLVSLIMAFIGILPYERKVSNNNPSEIKLHKQNALQHKRNYLWISAVAIILGFTIVVVDLIISLISCNCMGYI